MRVSHLLAFVSSAVSLACAAFVHPGLLHTAADFTRVAGHVNAGDQPWLAGWNNLLASGYSQSTYTGRPVAVLCRGATTTCTQNYATIYEDAAAAYALALRWKISGDDAFGTAAVNILNGWSSTLTEITGSADAILAAGIYGYELANAAEIMRGFDGFDIDGMINLLVNVFYPINHAFLVTHNGAAIDHYWANWDLCTMASIIATGILSDNETMFNEGVNYFYSGAGNGAIDKTVWILYDDGTGQVQEAGRDQGHTMLDIALLGPIAQMAYNQGVNLFTYNGSRILAGAEYAAKYNLGYDVQFTTYVNSDVTETVISNASRGDIRPIWDLLYNHYVNIEGETATYTEQYAMLLRSDGGGADAGGGSYGTESGGYDQLGYNTLMFAL